jgi:LAS superfamily LD-carboxypeptidase LdcB
MDRQHFLKLTALSGIALSIVPQMAFTKMSLSYDQLIGKGNPELFGEGYKLRKETYDAFVRMKTEALKSDISLKVVSSYRSFSHQNRIWERKYKNYTSQGLTAEKAIQKTIEYSTIPGTSRHHWGTDIDIVDSNVKQPLNLLNPSNFESDACFGEFKLWMDKNANDFGFYLVYTNDIDRKGFKYEPWHYSYKPLSFQYLSEYRQLNLTEILQKEKIMGGNHFTSEFFNNYFNEHILDINPELL